jgi:hypothetical protein
MPVLGLLLGQDFAVEAEGDGLGVAFEDDGDDLLVAASLAFGDKIHLDLANLAGSRGGRRLRECRMSCEEADGRILDRLERPAQ